MLLLIHSGVRHSLPDESKPKHSHKNKKMHGNHDLHSRTLIGNLKRLTISMDADNEAEEDEELSKLNFSNLDGGTSKYRTM